jgi:3-hydroxyisobutyrate dehydrogenase
MAEKPSVGFIGLGLMGKPMAPNILRAGFPLTVYNRSQGKVAELAAEGAQAAKSPAEVGRGCEFVVSCLPMPADVEQVYLGNEGVLAAARPGSIFIDMSTIDPATHRRIAAAATEKNIAYLDAPVSGGTAGAEKGTLTIMVGGDEAVLKRARPVLEAMGERIYHLGPVGSGAVAKLVNNMMAAINTTAAAEGMVLGVKAGLDPELLFEVVGNGSGASRMFSAMVPEVLRRNFEPGFMVDLMHKDASLAVELGKSLDVELRAGSLAVDLLQATRDAGHGRKSMFAEILPLEESAGVEVRKRTGG